MSRPAAATSLDRITALCDLGRFDEAVRAAARYLRTDPQDVQALCLLAFAHLGTGNPAEALRAAGAAAGTAPSEEWPHRLASIALQQLGNPAAAVAAAAAAVRADPHSALPRVRFADAARAHGVDLPAARRAAEDAVALDPQLVEAHLAVGDVAVEQRRRGDAAAAFRAALRLDPQCAAAHHALATLRVSGPHPASGALLAAAASGYATALRADPTAPQSRSSLDLVVADAVARTCVLVVLAAVWGVAFGMDPDAPRAASWVPLVLLVVPVAFVRQFVVRLTPAVRAVLVSRLRRPWPGLALAGFAVAAALLALGAAVPALDAVAASGALLVAVAVRVGLGAHVRRAGLVASRPRRRPRGS
ncbi:tetratricopeptide repeat protein [Geodermatophilus sp. SYSU D00758]